MALLRNRQIAAQMFAVFFVVGSVGQLVLLRSVAAQSLEGDYLFILPALVFVLAVYEWVESRSLCPSRIDEGQEPPSTDFSVWISVVIEALVPVSGIALLGGVLGWPSALGGPPLIGAALIPLISTLRLDFRIPVVQGVVMAVGFWVMLVLAVDAADSPAAVVALTVNLQIAKGFLLLGCGMLAGIIAHQSRRRLEDVIREHSERENVQQALDVRTAEYERAAETILEKNELISILSHDLRAPLDGVASLAQLMARAPDRFTADDIRKYADEIHGTAHNLRELLDNLVVWAELRSGQGCMPLRAVVLAEVCAPVVQLFEPAITARQLTIEVSLPSRVQVRGDAAAVATIARNLLSNAVKFTPSGGRISVSTAGQSSPGRVALIVTDTGPGIDETANDSAELRPALGLALCRQLMGQLGGSLELRPAVEGGTEAWAWFQSTARDETAEV
ncbi:sensor histidine kinase [Synoicihabitans lomoniglobus]|uniref:histidine kinase n=1 Tax=Synoicihabitans lomoniglobus TaxID=2909285 RepID=A0AAE9ZXI2_9BACT|nr:HAMP domain-containing histidine kinase [Opitutaceae bacterium LMO-M01]WED64373.1 HAMP domain-containing sensor histidine kinase [Opitutaceae bacterium LMO-M01]